VLHAVRWKCRTQKSPKIRHICTIAHLCRAMSSQPRHVSTIGKSTLNSNISSTRPHNMVNFDPLGAETVSLVWRTPANFSGLCVVVSLLQRRRSTKDNQTLHDLWSSPGLVNFLIHFRGFLRGNGILPGATFTLRPSLALFYLAALLHGTLVMGVSQTLWH